MPADLKVPDAPVGIPEAFDEHFKLMFDLQVLAYQTDLTRVVTFMMGRELSGRTFPQIGVIESHHATSHHQGDPVKLANLQKIKAHHAELFAYYVEKLRATPDGDGSLLDHMMILFGAGMSDSNAHSGLNQRRPSPQIYRRNSDGQPPAYVVRQTRRARSGMDW